ncbi:hypothetical protein SPI_09402 [Niveomyces insectorum RCEF 264]|uniref:Secreted protein n=1 Tax=Niveomyces insectorum RCEF 264 TaxID=1081102 RepID=A0A167LT82_9HYPO|nr:hypothetical protein SPI_09402 [Niveomyces insectorum RCEF 264]
MVRAVRALWAVDVPVAVAVAVAGSEAVPATAAAMAPSTLSTGTTTTDTGSWPRADATPVARAPHTDPAPADVAMDETPGDPWLAMPGAGPTPFSDQLPSGGMAEEYMFWDLFCAEEGGVDFTM